MAYQNQKRWLCITCPVACLLKIRSRIAPAVGIREANKCNVTNLGVPKRVLDICDLCVISLFAEVKRLALIRLRRNSVLGVELHVAVAVRIFLIPRWMSTNPIVM